MEMEKNQKNNQNEDDQGPFLSSKVKDIFKSRNKEKKQKKNEKDEFNIASSFWRTRF